MPYESDYEILRKAVDGDNEAFAEFLDRYGGLIWSTALRIVQNADAAADVFQESSIAIHQNLKNIRDHMAVTIWVMVITKNAAFDWLQKHSRHGRTGFDVDSVAVDGMSIDDTDSNDRDELSYALANVSDEDRRLLQIQLSGDDYKESSKEVGLKKSRYFERVSEAREAAKAHIFALRREST